MATSRTALILFLRVDDVAALQQQVVLLLRRRRDRLMRGRRASRTPAHDSPRPHDVASFESHRVTQPRR